MKHLVIILGLLLPACCAYAQSKNPVEAVSRYGDTLMIEIVNTNQEYVYFYLANDTSKSIRKVRHSYFINVPGNFDMKAPLPRFQKEDLTQLSQQELYLDISHDLIRLRNQEHISYLCMGGAFLFSMLSIPPYVNGKPTKGNIFVGISGSLSIIWITVWISRGVHYTRLADKFNELSSRK
ncbi:MAG: hypothetical protein WD077_02220 [Bacteroidia bacterium]